MNFGIGSTFSKGPGSAFLEGPGLLYKVYRLEAYPKPIQTSKIQLFAKTVSGIQLLTIFAKRSTYVYDWILSALLLPYHIKSPENLQAFQECFTIFGIGCV